MALHAILFFGFSSLEISGPGTIPILIQLSVTPVDAVTVDSLPSRDDPAEAPVTGPPAATRPELPEPVINNDAPDIAMPPSPVRHDVIKVDGERLEPIGPRRDGPGGVGFEPRDFVAGQLDNPPRTRSQVAPVYPYEARISGRNGEVMVEFVVDETGHVLDPHVLRSNDPVFEAPTLRAISKWRFEPGRKGGRVVRFRMAVPVGFSVN